MTGRSQVSRLAMVLVWALAFAVGRILPVRADNGESKTTQADKPDISAGGYPKSADAEPKAPIPATESKTLPPEQPKSTQTEAPKPPAEPPRTGVVEQVPRDQAIAILGHTVSTPEGKTIGRLVDVLVNAAGSPEAAVIDFGGFMGVGARKVAVHWSTLRFSPADPNQPITLDLTPDQIKAVPEYRDTNKPAPVVVPATAQAGPAATPPPSSTP